MRVVLVYVCVTVVKRNRKGNNQSEGDVFSVNEFMFIYFFFLGATVILVFLGPKCVTFYMTENELVKCGLYINVAI